MMGVMGVLGVCKFVPVTITVELDVLHCELMAVPQCVGGWQQVSCFSFWHETVCLCVSAFIFVYICCVSCCVYLFVIVNVCV